MRKTERDLNTRTRGRKTETVKQGGTSLMKRGTEDSNNQTGRDLSGMIGRGYEGLE